MDPEDIQPEDIKDEDVQAEPANMEHVCDSSCEHNKD